MKETYCFYEKKWIPLGRDRTRCPKCGAELYTHHEVRTVEKPKKEAKNGNLRRIA